MNRTIKRSKLTFFTARAAAALLAGVMAVSTIGSAAAETTATPDTATPAEDALPALWADGNPDIASAGRDSLDVIKWFARSDMGKTVTQVGKTKSDSYYLMLPTTADRSSLTIWHTFPEDPKIGDKIIKNGEATDAFADTDVLMMTVGDDEYKLTVMQSQFIGSMYINTESGSMSDIHLTKNNKESGDILVVEADGTADYNGALESIKGRGNTTWGFKKRPYNIKLDKKAPLYGMDASKKWCLLANAQDNSLMRNKIAYDLADELGLEYSPDSQFTDLYLNGEYVGVYQVTEKVEEGKNNLVKINDLTDETEKVNDKKLSTYTHVDPGTDKGTLKYYEIPNDPDDITGGYLLEFDVPNKYSEEDSGFVTKRGQAVVIKGPECATKAQAEYISSFMQDLEDALYSYNGYNAKGKHYTDYLDMRSAALMYLIQEYSLNIDAGNSSCFFYKDSDAKGDGKLHASPVWDFDVAFGNLDNTIYTYESYDEKKLTDTDAIYVDGLPNWYMGARNFFSQLCVHKDFSDEVKKLFKDSFLPALNILNSSENVTGDHLGSIVHYREMLSPSAEMNFIRWRLTDNLLVGGSGKKFDKQVDYLSNFTSKRAEFFEDYFSDKPAGDELMIYFAAGGVEWDEVYVYYSGGETTVDWPGVKMEPYGEGLDNVYKLDLAALGEKDTGDIHVIFNDGSDFGTPAGSTPAIKAKNNRAVQAYYYTYTMEDGTEIEGFDIMSGYYEESRVEKITYIVGDLDGDGSVTSADALKLLRISVSLEYYETNTQFLSGMIDDDIRTTSSDALYVLRYSVGLHDDTLSPIGEEQVQYKYIDDDE